MRVRERLGRCVVLSALMSAAIVAGVTPLVAQVVYSILPAKPQNSQVPVTQPDDEGRNPRVTLAVRDSTVGYVINAIARQGHLRTAYDNGDPIFAKRITIRVTDASVSDAFVVALKGTGLIAKMTSDGETVVISSRPGTSPATQSRLMGGIVAGRVTDSASGRGLKGASVKVAGTKLGVLTSDSGKFTLPGVPSGNQVLTIRLFGYRPTERQVTVVDSERTTVVVAMAPVTTVLSGVITTATGLQRKVEVGNDVTKIDVDSTMRIAPITSVTDLLETRVPGLTVQRSSGIPGDPARIRLRGVSSISGNNDPIVVVDGIRVYSSQSDSRNNNLAQSQSGDNGNKIAQANGRPGGNSNSVTGGYAAPSPLDQIDPNNIATIEVFKGPSASALYGSDAANGVIVITTKHGHVGPTHWQVDLGQGVNWLPGSWPQNYYKFGKDLVYVNDFINLGGQLTAEHLCSWGDLACVVDSLVPYQALNDPRYSVFSHGTDQTASLTVSGGVSTLQYSLSGSDDKTVGNLKLPAVEQQRYDSLYGKIPNYLVRPDNYQRWSVSGSLTAQPTPATRVTLQSSLFDGTQQQGSLQGAILQLEGEYLNPLVLKGQPLIVRDEEKVTDAQLTSTNALSFDWHEISWLPLNATAGINTIEKTDQSYIPYGVYYGGVNNDIYGHTINEAAPADTNGSYGFGHGTSRDQTLTIRTAIPLFRQRMTLTLGGNLWSQSTTDVNTYTNQLAPGISVPTNFLTCVVQSPVTTICGNSPTTQTTTNQSTFGWFVEPRLNIASKFFVAPGFRLDGGSGGTHTSNGGSGLSAFPKIDLSYVAVDQSHPHGPLTLLRPRLAFGLAGTQPDPAAKLRLFNDSAVAVGTSTVLPSLTLSTLGNTQLRPETSRELEGGFDAELWQGRLVLTVTQYNKTRYNAIISLPIAPSVIGPIADRQVNIGEIRNTGTELTFTATPIQLRSLNWTVGANLSNNDNLVVKLAPGFLPDEQLGIVAGYPLFGDWARPIISVSDLNHNEIIEKNEYQVGDSNVYVGQAEPKYQLNMNTGITLLNGRLSVNAGFSFVNGMTQNNTAAVTSNAVNFIANAPGSTLATKAAIEAATCIASNYGSESSCPPVTTIGFYQTVEAFRFNSLSVNYVLPGTLTNWLRVPHASVAIQGSNLGLHTNYRGIDPNVNAFSTVSGGDETADLGQLPSPRTWWLKLNLGN